MSTPSHHYPIVRIVADKSIATIGSDIRYCSTVPTTGGVINTSDPCYPICWTPATGTPVLDPDDLRWKCSICYDSSTNAPVLCGTGAGTGNNIFAWTMPTTVGATYQESTTSSSLNTVVKYDGIEIALKLRLKITGSECGGEGEGTLSIPVLPKWREINP